MYLSKWTTITEDGELKSLYKKEPKYNSLIEDNTNYKFSTQTKIKGVAKEVLQEASKTSSTLGNVLDNISAGIKNSAKVFKYLPYLAVAGGIYII